MFGLVDIQQKTWDVEFLQQLKIHTVLLLCKHKVSLHNHRRNDVKPKTCFIIKTQMLQDQTGTTYHYTWNIMYLKSRPGFGPSLYPSCPLSFVPSACKPYDPRKGDHSLHYSCHIFNLDTKIQINKLLTITFRKYIHYIAHLATQHQKRGDFRKTPLASSLTDV